jgi:hypothetical protein
MPDGDRSSSPALLGGSALIRDEILRFVAGNART